MIDALKVYPLLDGRLEKMSEDLTQRSYGSRTFTCNSLQFKTILSSQVNDGMKCNFFHVTLLFGAARRCLIWWEV